MKAKPFKLSALIAVISALLAPTASSQAAKPDTTSYEVSMKCSFGNMGTRTMHMKGSDFCFEAKSGGGLKIKFIKNAQGGFQLHRSKPAAWRYPPGHPQNSAMNFLPGPVGDVKAFLAAQKAKKTGSEKISGKKCDIYSYREKETARDCKLWVDPKTKNPVRLVMLAPRKADIVTVTYLSYKRGIDIPDSTFKIPEGVKVRDVPETSKDSGGAKTPAAKPGAG